MYVTIVTYLPTIRYFIILGFNYELPPGLFPTFFLHMERGDGKKIFLLTSRRRIKSSTCSVSKELLNRN